MPIIKPFRSIRTSSVLARELASLPYDVLSTEEAKIIGRKYPNSFLHITKSEIDVPADKLGAHLSVYKQAEHNLQQFLKDNRLFYDQQECYYIYELTMSYPSDASGNTALHTQTGLVALSSLIDYENNKIKKHELTRPDKELDRILHIQTTGVQTGNVFLAYRANNTIKTILNDWKKSNNTIYNFTAAESDGIIHKAWCIDDRKIVQQITDLFVSQVDYTYIADGHHRAASAYRVYKENSNIAPYFLTTIFPTDELHIMEYNRVVKDINGLNDDLFIKAIEENFIVNCIGKTTNQPIEQKHFGMFLSGNWYELIAKHDRYANDIIGSLDVSILQNQLLSKILNINDPRTDKRIDFIGGIRGTKELERCVNSGQARVAFKLAPLPIETLLLVADNNEIMPPKSTWFEPKLRDGLFSYSIISGLTK
ncbi:MAG: DUF1015 family protein [Phycisphaerales bacterium]|nr:DUF1015 family protein [Phycisphaerales bacterium]